MSAREPESCLQISGERRMTITIAAIAAASSKATNRDIMSAREKEAAAKQTFTFLAPLTNEQPCEAGRESAIARVRECRGRERVNYDIIST